MSVVVRGRPKGWNVVDSNESGEMLRGVCGATGVALQVIVADADDNDGRSWRHVSVKRLQSPRPPTWDDMEWVRRQFIGDWETYQIHPPYDRYRNDAEVLHLWACLDASDRGRLVPAFETLGWV